MLNKGSKLIVVLKKNIQENMKYVEKTELMKSPISTHIKIGENWKY